MPSILRKDDSHSSKCRCKICGDKYPKPDSYRHDGGWVCECCWDDRLKITE